MQTYKLINPVRELKWFLYMPTRTNHCENKQHSKKYENKRKGENQVRSFNKPNRASLRPVHLFASHCPKS